MERGNNLWLQVMVQKGRKEISFCGPYNKATLWSPHCFALALNFGEGSGRLFTALWVPSIRHATDLNACGMPDEGKHSFTNFLTKKHPLIFGSGKFERRYDWIKMNKAQRSIILAYLFCKPHVSVSLVSNILLYLMLPFQVALVPQRVMGHSVALQERSANTAQQWKEATRSNQWYTGEKSLILIWQFIAHQAILHEWRCVHRRVIVRAWIWWSVFFMSFCLSFSADWEDATSSEDSRKQEQEHCQGRNAMSVVSQALPITANFCNTFWCLLEISMKEQHDLHITPGSIPMVFDTHDFFTMKQMQNRFSSMRQWDGLVSEMQ